MMKRARIAASYLFEFEALADAERLAPSTMRLRMAVGRVCLNRRAGVLEGAWNPVVGECDWILNADGAEGLKAVDD